MDPAPSTPYPAAVERIAAATRLGAVHLSVGKLEPMVAWYQRVLGLQVHARNDGAASLGAGREDLLILAEIPGGQRYRGTTGLYHFAILLPARRDLARMIARLSTLAYPNYPTDHVMTETTYLDDPEGNGIELYVDTPEDGTFGFEDGQFIARDAQGVRQSGREPLDLDVLFRELPANEPLDLPLPAATQIGHVHLHVANLDRALHFYHDILGFDTMGVAEAFQAGFVSAGGYHHHIGLNTWAGEGAPPPPDDALGLRYFTVVLPTPTDLDLLADRLRTAGIPSETLAPGILVRDPSHNGVLLTFRSGGVP